MSQDLRLYSLSLAIVLLLWMSPVRADYGVGTGCPNLQVLVDLDYNPVYDDPGDYFRNIYALPGTGTSLYVSSDQHGDEGDGFIDCEIKAGVGTYYDAADHLWTLDENLTCGVTGGDTWDFRAGNEY